MWCHRKRFHLLLAIKQPTKTTLTRCGVIVRNFFVVHIADIFIVVSLPLKVVCRRGEDISDKVLIKG